MLAGVKAHWRLHGCAAAAARVTPDEPEVAVAVEEISAPTARRPSFCRGQRCLSAKRTRSPSLGKYR